MIIERNFRGHPDRDLHKIRIGKYVRTFVVDCRIGYKAIKTAVDCEMRELKRFVSESLGAA